MRVGDATGYDYVVIGAGTAGCVLAARLSADRDTRVLLLEAGSATPVQAAPMAWQGLLGGSADWGDTTVTQSVTGRSLPVSRGLGLGGSSAINGMNHVRGHRSSYDAWAAHGATRWGFDDLLPYFMRSEDAIVDDPASGRSVSRDPALRGTGGPMRVGPVPGPSELAAAWVEAGVRLGHPRAADPSGGLEPGFGWWDVNVVDGVRQSAADAYLRPVLTRDNLRVVTGAFAHRLRLERGRCVGVEYAVDGELRSAHADREVVCTAGVFGSAQLLQLSGIGPARRLREAGIEVRVDLPGVGANLCDHTLAAVVYAAARPVPVVPTKPTAEVVGLVVGDGDLARPPDLQTLLLTVPLHVPGIPVPENGFTIAFSGMAPRSRGTVSVAGPDPTRRPLVDPGYYRDEHDVLIMQEGLRLARELGRAEALAPWREMELFPGPSVHENDLDAVRGFLFSGLQSYQHLGGTCRLGTDQDAVVDLDLRVHAVEGLRVADASVMPSLPSANINATVLGIAERAAELIATSTAPALSEAT